MWMMITVGVGLSEVTNKPMMAYPSVERCLS